MKNIRRFFLFGLTITVIFFSACADKKEQTIQRDDTGLFLVAGTDVPVDEVVTVSLNASGIRQKGYVVIIGVPSNQKAEQMLKKAFYKQEIYAVHVLNFRKGQKLKHTDIITVKNASIILFPEMSKKDFPVIKNNTELKKTIRSAAKKQALVAAVGQSASLLGAYYLQKKLTIPALSLNPNLILDKRAFYDSNKAWIQQKIKKKKLLFAGLDGKSLLLFNGSQGKNLGASDILLVTSDDKEEVIKKGKVFLLLTP